MRKPDIPILKSVLYLYLWAHHIIVMMDQPMCQIFSKPNATSRILKYPIELSDFDISYKLRTAIKARAVVDFMVEMTIV